jgi:tetratricopeptide (TPR) repeat protein
MQQLLKTGKQAGKFILMMFIFFGASVNCYAQKQGQPLIDSLLKELPKQKEDTNKVNIINELSREYRPVNPDEGIKYAIQALELATKLDWQKGIAWADDCLGLNYWKKSDYVKALACYDKALKINEKIDYKKGIASVLVNTASVYVAQGDYAGALKYDLIALKVDEECGCNKCTAVVTGNIGIVYQYQRDYTKALEYYSKALNMHEEAGDKIELARVTANIGLVYDEQGNYAQALAYDFKALKTCEETGSAYGIAFVTGLIGIVYRDGHNYAQALAWHFKALQTADESGTKNSEVQALEFIAEDYMSMAAFKKSPADTNKILAIASPIADRPDSLLPNGRLALLDKAIECVKKAIATDEETGSQFQLQDAYLQLSRAYAMQGYHKLASDAREEYDNLKEDASDDREDHRDK